ncbi:type II secretion system protein N [Massilia sp. 9096]|uniref:type II secretion system protein N n=1 Tax=Massilia sp. 9096 TaxID=1500894 RepID=UPI00068C1387|nr:type II secretion system protein N [Massilia sp. 9096]
MNKRLPILLSLLGVILLAASIAYWVLQLVQPPQRPMAAVQTAQAADPPIDAAATLFGGQMAVATATNYQLTGIVSAGRNSVAIIVADGAQPKALRIGKELSPGITLAEVYPRYVMLSDNGAMKRIDLAPDSKGGAQIGGAGGGMAPPGVPNNAGSVQPIMPSPTAPAGNAIPEPPMSPGAVPPQLQAVNPGDVGQHDAPQQQQQQQQNGNPNQGNPPPNQIQMPPPTRAVGVPGATPAVQ